MSRKVELRRSGPRQRWFITVRHQRPSQGSQIVRKATHEEIDLWHQLHGERIRRAKTIAGAERCMADHASMRETEDRRCARGLRRWFCRLPWSLRAQLRGMDAPGLLGTWPVETEPAQTDEELRIEVARLEREERVRWIACETAWLHEYAVGGFDYRCQERDAACHLQERDSLRRRLAATGVAMMVLWFAVAAVGGHTTKPVVAPHAQIGAAR